MNEVFESNEPADIRRDPVVTFPTASAEASNFVWAAIGLPLLLVVAVFIAGFGGIRVPQEVIFGISVLGVLGLLSIPVLYAIPGRLSVGADGLALRWIGKRFIAYRDILALSRYEWGRPNCRMAGLVVVLEHEEVRIPLGAESPYAIVEERIRKALDTYHRGDVEADEAALGRRDRSIAAWIVALRAIGAGADADPRTAPIPHDRLWRIVDDPSAEKAVRAAAAVALEAR